MKLIRVLYYLFMGLFVALFALSYVAELFFMPGKREIEKEVMEKTGYPLTYHTYPFQQTNLGYAATGNDTAQRVIFVHGSPGAWGNFSELLTNSWLAKNFSLIAVDRYGYGISEGEHGNPDLGFQAACIRPLCVPSKGGRKPILVGHSMGGPIVIKSAIDYGNELEGVISVAGSFDPALEFNEFYRGFFKIFPFNLIFSRNFKASNDELFTHAAELTRMSHEWDRISCMVTIIQGGKDRLVDPGNIEFAKAKLKTVNAGFIYIEHEDHFIPFTNPQPMVNAINDMSH